jgi:dynein heavy chain
VLCDRFVKDKFNDGGEFRKAIENNLKAVLDVRASDLYKSAPSEIGIVCVSFLKEGGNPPYEHIHDFTALKRIVEEKLEDYNSEPKLLSMNLVMFSDAICHVCRIHRVINQGTACGRKCRCHVEFLH